MSKEPEPVSSTGPARAASASVTAAPSAPPPPREQAKTETGNGASDTIVLLTALFLAGSDIHDTATLVDQARQGKH
jgi:hypothetical protein